MNQNSNKVKCELCGRLFRQITDTHLRKAHEITFAEYKQMFPNSATLPSDIHAALSEIATQKVADGIIGFHEGHTVNAGKTPWNKGTHGLQVSWQKSKTKETCPSIARAAEKVSHTKKQMFADGRLQRPIGKINPMYGKTGWNKGRTKDDCPQLKSVSEKVSAAMQEKIQAGTLKKLYGKDNPMFGKKISEEHRKALWGGWKSSGTKPELKMLDLLKPFPNWEYTANGKFFVRTDKKCRVPDFVNKKSKKIIEVYGDYWHRNDNPQDQIDEYKRAGWDCVVVWEHEVMDDNYSIESLSNYL